jgi:uncharacterized protein (TIGR02147 family)
MHDWSPDIFDYLDYRKFMRDFYDIAQQHSRAFSYRALARRAEISSPSFLRHVMRGERNLAGTTRQVAGAFGLEGAAASYFEALVAFDQAGTNEERNQLFERIAASRRFRSARRLGDAMFTYLSRWYYPVIRELTASPAFQEDPAWIAGQLLPTITPEQAAEALQTLTSLELLVRDEAGRLVRADSSITTEHEVRALAVGNYHRQMLTRAGESIELVPREWRDLASMTVCVSPDTIREIKARVHAFRELLFDLCERDEQPSVVIQINSQVFPLSRLPDAP